MLKRSIYPVRFARPSVVNDTPDAWAKLERDYRQQFLRELHEAVQCFGAERVERDLHGITKGRQGRIPDKYDALLLKEHDSRRAKGQANNKGQVNLSKLAREFRKEHHLHAKADSVRRRLTRALGDRDKQAQRDREFQEALREPSIVGSGTKKII
jgi:hypothetical protein